MKKLLLLLFSIPFLGFSQGSMDFENTTLPSAYADGTFDDNGITYTYGHSRDQDTFNITNNGLLLRRASDSYLEWTIPNGIGELSFQFRKAYTGASVRQLEILIDDVVTFTTVEFGEGSGEQTDVYTFSEEINVEGSVTIKIKNVGAATGNKQTVIDNIVWTAHEGGSTEPEMGEATIQVGSGSGNSSYFPNYYYYGYSYTQTIYTADELHAAGAHANGGEISMIKYLPKASVSTEKWRNFAVYMVNTSKEGFDDNTDWVDFASLTPVFDGDLIDNTIANQWMEITLDNPFDWNGSDNILVAVVDKTPGYGGPPNWAGYTLEPSAGSKGIYKYRDGDPIDLIDPASGTGGITSVTNSVAQIQFFGTLQEVCTGTPIAGTVVQPLEICENQPFTLSLDGTTEGLLGITYQWQESADGTTWTDLVGANTASYTVTDGVTEEGFYRLVVTCVNSTETATSDAIATTLKVASECYCIPVGTNSSRFINNFSTTQGIQNVSNLNSGFSTGGYGDFTTMIVEQVQSGTIDFTGNISGGSAGFKIWVDWNQDGTFESTEVAYQSSGYSTSPGGSFTVPLDALPGTTRMRIVSNWSVNTGGENPCATNYSLGEFEDYTFEVIELTACAGTPEAGTVTDIETCGMEPFTLSTDGASSGQSGLTYQWEESADGSTWTELVGANTASYTVSAGISTETSYRLVVTCENTSESATSDALVVSLKAASECYCETNYADDVEPITLVEVKDGANTLFSNSSSVTSSIANEDFTSISAEVARDGEYEITVKGHTGGSFTNKVTIYIDWNQDGNFDVATEQYLFPDIFNSTGEDGVESVGTITVPADAVLGETRMRVTKKFNSVALPCNTSGYGQTEDYTLVIEEAAPITCDAPVDFTVNYDEVSETATVVIDGDAAYTYEVVYGETGFNPTADGTTIVTDLGNLTATIENLTDGSYDVYVRTICDLEDMSVFVGPENFIVGEVVVPDDCEWSVHVWGEAYMDEVYWELKDANNNILLSRAANYYDYNEDETLTVTAEGPLSFTIGADGFFSDNVANFTISNEAGIIAFGLVDGNVVTVTDLNCSDEALEPCTGTPDAGIVSINPESGVSGTEFTFEATGYSEGLGITYIIEYRFNNGVWQQLDVITPTLQLEPEGDVGDVIEIRLVVTCTESGLSSISNTVIYTIVDEAVDCTTFIASVDGDAEICEGDETTLTVTATGVIASVEWDNGATGTELVVTEAGTYNGTVTSEDGCVEEVSFEVTVNPLPTVDAIDVTDNGSGSYTFAAVDATNTVDYAWDFGNGSTSTDENPTFVYTVNGTYTVTLTVTNACGSTDVTTEVIFTGGIDCSTFTASIDGDAEICEGDETTLTVTATGVIASVEWSNGATGTDLLVTEAGTYEATVTSEDGCVEEVSFEVTVNPLPTVAGIAITENGEGSYTFAATDATDVTDYAWTFGDGDASSTDENPTYVYTEEGTYEVTLTVTNDCGTETVTETVVYSETGLDKNELIALNLFPNPSKEYVNVVYDGSYSIETIMVISPIGQKVFEVKVNGNNYQLDVTKYATGLYHMNIILSNGKMISRNFDVMK
ncbi:MAG TPA: GEVED domain-containing protein [Brumimicrobium sp.]|nr:GEVED domain-containing protein [Brumimicrobium sp.]